MNQRCVMHTNCRQINTMDREYLWMGMCTFALIIFIYFSRFLLNKSGMSNASQEENRPIRTLSEVQNLLMLAKLSPDAFTTPAQVLHFASTMNPQCNTEELILIEMEENLLEETLRSSFGLRVTSGTQPHGSAVLCSADATYELREAETSNSLLFIPNGHWPSGSESKNQHDLEPENRDIVAVKHHYLEARRSRARIEQLDEYLQKALYKDCGDEILDNTLSLEQLLKSMAGSERELRAALERRATLLVRGRVRLLDWPLESRCLAAALDLCAVRGWSLQDPLELSSLCGALWEQEGLLPAATECALRRHGRLSSDGNFAILDEQLLVRHTARLLLEGASRLPLPDFLSLWRQALPPGVSLPSTDSSLLPLLLGVALVEEGNPINTIRLFLEERLPQDARDRLAALFSARPKWCLKELQVYLEPVVGPGTAAPNVSALLAKYARTSTSARTGGKLYSKK